ncbi:nucleotidyltransferase domain-containing protein [Cohnella nanjingensis]|uniref:Amino acid transporter n=1 Tax=Cohnella nanjingensis TaxID=1387779 RepID=A0A7X0RW09_9BACL|nr:hypothetical protein [Cohnella nanjingensis]MBB6674698.1 hypothetical protein [Cohnella nanjingensis]
MRTDIHNWQPITVSEACAIFSAVPVQWCMAGGWALDLHMGKQSRPHDDIDILIRRDEQLTAYDHLSKEWTLYKAENGKLDRWEKGEFLITTDDIWVSKDDHSPWAYQIMLADTDHESWIYKRERSIRRDWEDVISHTQEGIPYLKPEIQLLYKGGSSAIREKDQKDFLQLLPLLHPQSREWLRTALKKQFPIGHLWVEQIKKMEV